MSIISFNCPGCQQPIEEPAEMAGQFAQCPSCGAEMPVVSALCMGSGFHAGLGEKIDTQL